MGWSGKFRRHKYDAQRTVFDGVTYDSKAEAKADVTGAPNVTYRKRVGKLDYYKCYK